MGVILASKFMIMCLQQSVTNKFGYLEVEYCSNKNLNICESSFEIGQWTETERILRCITEKA